MAEKLCSLRKKGGKMSETVLWTNPSPSSNFASQTVTLSSDIDDYKFLKFTYKNTTSGNIQTAIIIEVPEFKKMAAVVDGVLVALGAYSGYTTYARRVYYNNDTSVGFMNATGINAVTESNNMDIPLQIIGLK